MQLSELSQERLVGRQRQSAQNCLLAALRFGRDRTSRISTRKSPEVGGLRGSIRDFGDYEDCVVADAVAVEPVSTPKFLANREINMDFCQIRTLCDLLKANTRAIQRLSAKFPVRQNRELFRWSREFYARTGNFAGQTRTHRRMKFSVHKGICLGFNLKEPLAIKMTNENNDWSRILIGILPYARGSPASAQ